MTTKSKRPSKYNHEEDKDSEFMVAEEENTTNVDNIQHINEESDKHYIDTAGSTPTWNRDLVGRVMVVEPSHTRKRVLVVFLLINHLDARKESKT